MMQTPAYWDGERWIVQSVAALTRAQLQRIARWLVHVQRQRRLELIPGPRRDELDLTIRALREGKIVCGLRPEYAGLDGQQYQAFKATEGSGRIIVGAG